MGWGGGGKVTLQESRQTTDFNEMKLWFNTLDLPNRMLPMEITINNLILNYLQFFSSLNLIFGVSHVLSG